MTFKLQKKSGLKLISVDEFVEYVNSGQKLDKLYIFEAKDVSQLQKLQDATPELSKATISPSKYGFQMSFKAPEVSADAVIAKLKKS